MYHGGAAGRCGDKSSISFASGIVAGQLGQTHGLYFWKEAHCERAIEVCFVDLASLVGDHLEMYLPALISSFILCSSDHVVCAGRQIGRYAAPIVTWTVRDASWRGKSSKCRQKSERCVL